MSPIYAWQLENTTLVTLTRIFRRLLRIQWGQVGHIANETQPNRERTFESVVTPPLERP